MTNQFTDEQIKTAARKWIERLDSDAHWARSPGAREKASSEKKILEWLLEAAAGVAPQAESAPLREALKTAREHFTAIAGSGEIRVWEDTGEKLGIDHQVSVWAKRGERICRDALAASVQPSSTVDEAALIREAKAEALEEFAGQMATGFNQQTLNAERRAIKREARARAAEYRKAVEL